MRKVVVIAVLGGLVGGVLGIAAVPVVLWAQGGTFCWGSICQTSGGVIQFAGNVQPSQPIVLSTSPKPTTALPGDLVLDCQTAPSAAPGPGLIALRARNGKVFMVVGASPIEWPVVVFRNGILDTSSMGLGC